MPCSTTKARTSMTDSPSLLIVGHGTRAADGAAEFHALADRVVSLAPELRVAAGFTDVVAIPLMLLAAGHAKNDIPATLVRERLAHPGVRFRYGRELGVRPEL